MSWMGQLSDKHRRGSVFETQAETNDGTGNCKHDESVGERLEEYSDNDDHRADDDSVLSPNFLNKPPEKELRSNTTKTLRTIEDTEFGAGGIVKVPGHVSLQVV